MNNQSYYHYKNSKGNILKAVVRSLDNAELSRNSFINKLKESADQKAIKYFPDIKFRVNSILTKTITILFLMGLI